jgi:RNA polymerase sigma-70 factor, ECF subfamily
MEPITDIATLYCKHYQRVLAWCSSAAQSREEAQDLAQDSFIQVMRKIHTFRGEAAITTWLYRVVKTTVLMRLRKKGIPQVSLDEMLASEERFPSRSILRRWVRATPVDSIARVDLSRAISQLPDGFRTVLLLYDVEDYRHHEIAEIMGLSIGTTKSQLHRARQKMRELLEDGTREENSGLTTPDLQCGCNTGPRPPQAAKPQARANRNEDAIF